MATSPKMKFPDWLKEKINCEEYKGLEWDGEGKFKIPWVREGSDPNWVDYYKLFHAWDQRNGGQRHENKEVKQKFRAALNKSKCVMEVKEESEKDLQTGSYKVYRFTTMSENSQTRFTHASSPESLSRGRSEGSTFCFSSPGGNFDDCYYDSQPLFGMVDTETCFVTSSNEMFLQQPSLFNPESMAISIPSFTSEDQNNFMRSCLKGIETEKCITIISYNEREIFSDYVNGFGEKWRVYYRDEKQQPVSHCIELSRQPEFDNPKFQNIIDHLGDGFTIWYDRQQMAFYLERLKTCHVYIFYFNPHAADSEPVKVEKQKPVEIFSYHSYYKELCCSKQSIENCSVPVVIIAVGCRPAKKDYVKGIKVVLKPCGAVKMHQESSSMSVLMSEESLEEKFSNMSTN